MNPKKLKTRSPLKDVFTIRPEDLSAITENMREQGYWAGYPIITWNGDIVAGHTRQLAAIDADISDVPTVEREFDDDADAIAWMYREQKDRRPPSEAEFIQAVAIIDKLKEAGRHTGNQYTNDKNLTLESGSREPDSNVKKEAQRSAQQTAKALGTSAQKVKQARAVNKAPEAKAQVQNGTATLNKAYTQVRKEEKIKKEIKKEQESFALTADSPPPLVQVAKLPPVESRGLHIPTPAEIEYLRLDKKQKFNEQKNSDIEWAMWSWNPVTGCNHGCTYCYARVIAMGIYKQKFVPTFIPERLSAPRNTKVPDRAATEIGWKNVFVCSMADLWGKWVPRRVIECVMREVRENPQWNYLFLTKFPDRYLEFEFPKHTWVGTSVDTQAAVKRAETSFEKLVKQGHKGVRWLSVEPMLEPVKFNNLSMFNWLVVGGQAAFDQNGLKVDRFIPPFRWYHNLIKQADDAKIPVYMKENIFACKAENRLCEYPKK